MPLHGFSKRSVLKKDWRDQEGENTNYFYIPLIELARTSRKYDIRTLKDASYLLKDNQQIEIFGDDFEPYGMLVKILDAGLEVQQQSIDFKNRIVRKIKHWVFPFLALSIGAWMLISGDKDGGQSKMPKQNSSTVAKR